VPESETGQERTIPLTPRRRQQLRQDGDVPKSQEVNSVFILLVGFLVFYLHIGNTISRFSDVLRHSLETINYWSFSNRHEVWLYAVETVINIGLIILPYLIMLFLAALLANLFQVGFLMSEKPIVPKLDRISPLQGFKRIFSWRGVMEMVKSIVKIGTVATIAWLVLKGNLFSLPLAIEYGVWDQLLFLGGLASRVTFFSILALMAMSLFDFMFQKFQYERQHRMTPEELKREMKETEGDPQLKARVRQIQREMSRQRMMAEVPRADVVVTNPTQYAVALRYRSLEGEAPVVLARGRGHVATRIRQVANENDIPIVENRALAQALYKSTEPGMEIPEELYAAVAEVLAYIHRMGQMKENLAEAMV
jgi:flagellar biosynthesis protein FlhB